MSRQSNIENQPVTFGVAWKIVGGIFAAMIVLVPAILWAQSVKDDVSNTRTQIQNVAKSADEQKHDTEKRLEKAEVRIDTHTTEINNINRKLDVLIKTADRIEKKLGD
jgi:septal ring factor EnvC (AmiA/AmiB activator)